MHASMMEWVKSSHGNAMWNGSRLNARTMILMTGMNAHPEEARSHDQGRSFSQNYIYDLIYFDLSAEIMHSLHSL